MTYSSMCHLTSHPPCSMNAETLAATKNELLAELHKDVFLTPKGMVKFVQLFVVICAFAMTTSASGACFVSCSVFVCL